MDASEKGTTVCDDGVDNDGDGKSDFLTSGQGDPSCSGPTDASEKGTVACDDGKDNDGDGKSDFLANGQGDPGCSGPTDASEKGTAACDDGQDNDGDGKSDFPADPDCSGPSDASEAVCTWQAVSAGTQDLRGIWGSSASALWAVGKAATILHYDGSAWKAVAAIPSTQHLHDLWGISATNIVAVGEKGTILHYNGSQWLDETPFKVEDKNDKQLYGIWGAGANQLWISGSPGLVLFFDGQWKMSMSVGGEYHKAWGSSATDVWIVGTKNTIWHYNGSSWSNTLVNFPGGTLFGVFGSSATNFWAVGEMVDGGLKRPLLLKYQIDGSFAAHPKGSSFEGSLARLWVSPSGKAWAVGSSSNGQKGLILHYNGSDWLNVTPGTIPPQNAIWGFSDADVWSVGNGGSSWRCH
jgi:hypothetical protein